MRVVVLMNPCGCEEEASGAGRPSAMEDFRSGERVLNTPAPERPGTNAPGSPRDYRGITVRQGLRGNSRASHAFRSASSAPRLRSLANVTNAPVRRSRTATPSKW